MTGRSHLMISLSQMGIILEKEVTGMPGIKEQVIQMIQELPEDITVDDVMAELYFRLQVDAGLKELDEGQRISHEEVEKRMGKWLTR